MGVGAEAGEEEAGVELFCGVEGFVGDEGVEEGGVVVVGMGRGERGRREGRVREEGGGEREDCRERKLRSCCCRWY